MVKYRTKINARGEQGNVYVVLATATTLLKRVGTPSEEVKALQTKVFNSKNYEEALNHVREYFEVITD